MREFLRWHVGFWCRYARRRDDGSWPTMQQREDTPVLRSRLEALLAGESLDPGRAPAMHEAARDTDLEAEG